MYYTEFLPGYEIVTTQSCLLCPTYISKRSEDWQFLQDNYIYSLRHHQVRFQLIWPEEVIKLKHFFSWPSAQDELRSVTARRKRLL